MVAERLENVTDSASRGNCNHGESPSRADDMSPLGLIESLKSLKQIVSQSVETTDEAPPQISPKQEVTQDFSHLCKHRVTQVTPDVSTVSDLPEKQGKEGLFMGLMGA